MRKLMLRQLFQLKRGLPNRMHRAEFINKTKRAFNFD